MMSAYREQVANAFTAFLRTVLSMCSSDEKQEVYQFLIDILQDEQDKSK